MKFLYLFMTVGLLVFQAASPSLARQQKTNSQSAQAVPTTGRPPSPLAAADQMPADLTTDARLDHPYSLHEIGMPLSALLLKVSQGDLSLIADHNCEALELHLNLLNRPLRQLMTSLAQLVPGNWYKTPDGKGYVLRMNWKSVSRRQRWWDLYLEERQRVLQKIPALALKAMGARPEIKGEAHSADGNDEGFKQFLLEGPAFFSQIPASLQKQVANNLNEMSLFAGVRGTGIDEGALMVPFTDLPSEAQERMLQRMKPPARVRQSDVYVLFKNDGSGISADPVDAEGANLGMGFGMDVPFDTDEPTLRPGHNGLLRKVKRMEKAGEDVPPVWKELAVYQESRVWPNNLPPKGYNSSSDRISDLEKMAEEDHLEFVSDYYSLPIPYGFEPTPRLSPQVKEDLNRLDTRLNVLAINQDLSWKQTPSKIYLLRNNRWYRDDRLEVPSPLLQRWLKQNMRELVKNPPTVMLEGEPLRHLLDWQAEVVTTLTPWQIFYGLRWATVSPEQRKEYGWDLRYMLPSAAEAKHRYAPFKRLVNASFSSRYHLLQFYATLSKEQRTALLGGGLDFTTLTADQQQQAFFLQPLLVALVRQSQSIVLGLRHRAGGSEVGDINMRLMIIAPSSKPLNTSAEKHLVEPFYYTSITPSVEADG